MGRKRRASLWNCTAGDSKLHGLRFENGQRLPGFYVRYSSYAGDTRINRSLCFDTLKTAKAWVAQYNAKLELRQAGFLVPVPIEEAIREYLSSGSSWAEDTGRQYGVTLGLFRDSVGAATKTTHLQVQHIDQFLTERSAGGKSKATVAKHVRGLNAFLEWCIRRNYCEANPLPMATSLPRRNIKRKRPVISDELLARLVDLAGTPDRKLAIAIAMSTGMDRGAVEKLTAEMIDTEHWCIPFTRQKTGEINVVGVPLVLVPELQKRIDQRPGGQPLLRGLTRQKREKDWWSAIRDSVGMPGLLFRDLRAVASKRLMTVGGATLQQAKNLLGHASIATTSDHYDIPDPTELRLLHELPVPGFPSPSAKTKEKP